MEWSSIYETLRRHDALAHRALLPLLARRRPFRLLDLGCGDGGAAVLLSGSWSSYLGVDNDPHALEQARRNLPAGARVHQADLVEFLEQGVEGIDLVLAAYVLHRFGAADKQRLIGLLPPGSSLAMLDLVRSPEESVEDFWLRHFAWARAHWGFLSQGELASYERHKRAWDRPEEAGWWAARLAEAGFAEWEWLGDDPSGTARLLLARR